MIAGPVPPPPVPATVPPGRPSRLVADTGRIWLVVGAMAFLVMLVQALAGGLVIGLLTIVMIVVVVALMIRDARRLERRVAVRLRIWSVVAALTGLVLVIPFSTLLFGLFKGAYYYTLHDPYYRLNFLVILLVQVVISVLWFPLLRGKLGRAAVWPALIYLLSALMMTMIIVTNFDTLVW